VRGGGTGGSEDAGADEDDGGRDAGGGDGGVVGDGWHEDGSDSDSSGSADYSSKGGTGSIILDGGGDALLTRSEIYNPRNPLASPRSQI
jgi:hypothetical protein